MCRGRVSTGDGKAEVDGGRKVMGRERSCPPLSGVKCPPIQGVREGYSHDHRSWHSPQYYMQLYINFVIILYVDR